MDTNLTFFATAPQGIEPVLADELTSFGAAEVRATRGGVEFHGPRELAYRACLWSRTASRVLLPLATYAAHSADELYAGAAAIPWEEHLAPDGTLAVDFVGRSDALRNTQFGAQKVKDAVVDRFRERTGRRPGVDRALPDLRINVHLSNEEATVSVDLSGESLHRRGYREEGHLAPLKETLAAALLLKVGWPDIAAAGGPLLDPLCGSGTLVIEAALIAADRAPGIKRTRWGFQNWLKHDAAIWAVLVGEARRRVTAAIDSTPPLVGYDHDPRAITAARNNARRAGVDDRLTFERAELGQGQVPQGKAPGLLIANPPYGERLGEQEELGPLYTRIGDLLKSSCTGWTGAVFTGNPDLGKRMGVRARKVNAFHNGPLECKLLHFSVEPKWFVDRAVARPDRATAAMARSGEALANRLRKNLRRLEPWARQEDIHCYRVYDADIPEFNLAVDRYEQWAHIQEYAAPATIDPSRAERRMIEARTVVGDVLGIPSEQVVLKVRQRQRGRDQYEKLGANSALLEVREPPARFWVNLHDYLDTGLFLDARRTRRLVGQLAEGRDVLNLFGYTGSATVQAALGGARSTTTVDLSRTYLDWTRRNLELNGCGPEPHRLVRADVREWLEGADEDRRFGLIFLDPPTFSNSKRMDGTLDIQRDHVDLLRATIQRLTADGVLIFSTNFRGFKLDRSALTGVTVEEISRHTLPRDFQRRARMHHCFRLAPG